MSTQTVPQFALARMIDATGRTPEEHMALLADAYKKGMLARSKAYTEGFKAVHDALCEFTSEIERQQKVLLADYPELVFMVMGVR